MATESVTELFEAVRDLSGRLSTAVDETSTAHPAFDDLLAADRAMSAAKSALYAAHRRTS